MQYGFAPASASFGSAQVRTIRLDTWISSYPKHRTPGDFFPTLRLDSKR
jgi:hypothetical protein